MGGNKDGVKNLIQSFSLIKDDYPEINLLLLGTATSDDLADIRRMADTLAPHRVIFKGSVNREMIPLYLRSSKVLALARPSSIQSHGGFPTKLGEYLCARKPVIVTSVGDIPKYLKHRRHAFVVPPDDNRLFADELAYILTNYSYALEVADEGCKLALDVFDYKQQSIMLDKYLNSFKL